MAVSPGSCASLQPLLYARAVEHFRFPTCVGSRIIRERLNRLVKGKVTGSAPTERALLISHLHDQFWSEEYRVAAALVRQWSGGGEDDWAGDLFRELDRLDALPDERRRLVERTNAARRLIKSYFRKTQQFCSRGLLAPEDLRDHLTMAQRLEMLFAIVEPFERARKADYNREMFDFYDHLHRGELERPAR